VRLAPTPPRLFALAVAGQLIFGAVLALPGTLFGIPPWTAGLGLDVGAQANLLAVFYTSQLPCTAAAGVVVDRVGAQKVLALGSALLVSGFLLLARATNLPSAALAFSLLAAGASSINAASATLVSVTFGSRRGAMLSMMGLAGAVGAFTTPLLLAGPTDPGGVTARLVSLSIAAALVAALTLVVGEAPWEEAGISFRAMATLAKDHRLAALIALLSLEFGVEAVLAGWSGAYALAVMPAARPGLVVTLYWGGLCLGRSTTPLILRQSSKAATVSAAAGLAAVAIGVMATAPTVGWLLVAAFLSGVAVGPMAPTITAVAGDRYPQRTGLALGVLLSLAQLGGMVLPWVTGRTAVAAGFRLAMAVPLAAALALAGGAATVWVSRVARQLPDSRSEPA
jgi:fucose permease